MLSTSQIAEIFVCILLSKLLSLFSFFVIIVNLCKFNHLTRTEKKAYLVTKLDTKKLY